jgi:hypothetical protein
LFPPFPVLKNLSDELQCLHDLYAYKRNLLVYPLRRRDRRREAKRWVKEVISSEMKEKMRLQ